jgi:GT2 family glycosyltransferase
MSDARARASVVVVTSDRPGFAAQAAQSVLDGRLRPAEIIVVQRGRTSDDALERLRSADASVRVLRLRQGGLSSARNLGAKEAVGDVVAFVDDDELVSSEWLAAVVRELDGDETCFVTGRVLAGHPEVPDAVVPSTVAGAERRVFRGRLGRDVLAGGNMAARRSTFLALGGFDALLGPGTPWPAAEDNDLGLRALEAGHAIVYAPDAVVVHRAWRAGRSYPAIRWRYGLGKGGFYAKHLATANGYGLRRAARDVARRIARAPIAVWRRPRYALGELTYAAGVVVGLVRWRLRGGAR